MPHRCLLTVFIKCPRERAPLLTRLHQIKSGQPRGWGFWAGGKGGSKLILPLFVVARMLGFKATRELEREGWDFSSLLLPEIQVFS